MRVIPLWLLGLGLSVSTAFGTEVPPGRASTLRAFRVVMVDTGFKASWRTELNQQFRERFHQAVKRHTGAGFVVRTESSDARTAATRLSEGACEAVVILGGERPRAFWRIEIPAIAASMSADRNYEAVYLIVAPANAELRQSLGEALAEAVITPTPPRGTVTASD